MGQSWLRHPWVLGSTGIAFVVFLWWAITATGAVNSLFLPSPASVWAAGQQQFQTGLLWKDLTASVGRVFGGFALSAIVALPLGMAMGTSRVICRLLEPLIGLLRYMPAPAFIPLLIIYFGLG